MSVDKFNVVDLKNNSGDKRVAEITPHKRGFMPQFFTGAWKSPPLNWANYSGK